MHVAYIHTTSSQTDTPKKPHNSQATMQRSHSPLPPVQCLPALTTHYNHHQHHHLRNNTVNGSPGDATKVRSLLIRPGSKPDQTATYTAPKRSLRPNKTTFLFLHRAAASTSPPSRVLPKANLYMREVRHYRGTDEGSPVSTRLSKIKANVTIAVDQVIPAGNKGGARQLM